MKKLLLVLCLLPLFSYAGVVHTNGYFQIKDVWVWSSYAQNTFKVSLVNQDETMNAHCPDGFWLDQASTTGSHLLKLALSAYETETKVMIYAFDDVDWSEISSKECKIALIKLAPKGNL